MKDSTFYHLLHPFDRDAGIIFITIPDVVGYRVAINLLKAGYPQVRVGVSNETDERVKKELEKEGAVFVPFKWEDESSYTVAVQGAKTVFCIVPHHSGWADHFPVFFDACRSAGTDHFIKLSFYHALTATRAHVMKGFHVALPEDNPFTHIPLIRMHGDCDERKSKNMDYTLLFATHLMSNPAVYQSRNILSSEPRFYGASGGKGVNYVSPNDVAAAAVRILVNPVEHRRVGYTLTGPAPITDTTVAELFSKDLNKPVKYVDLSPEEFGTEEKKEGDPSWLVEDLVQLETLKATGMEIGFLSKDFERLCGRPAESFDEYLQDKKDMVPQELLI